MIEKMCANENIFFFVPFVPEAKQRFAKMSSMPL